MGNPNPNPNPMNSKQTNERKKNWTKKPTAAQTMCTVLNWYSHLSFTDFFVLFRCWCSLLLRSIKLSVSYGTQIHAIEWLCGGLLFLLPFSSSFFCCVWGVNTQIFNMDNRECVECVETTKTESICLVGQRNTDQENVKKTEEGTHTHTPSSWIDGCTTLAQSMCCSLLASLITTRSSLLIHTIVHTHIHTCEPSGVSRAPFVLTI